MTQTVQLPHETDTIFLMDGGAETTLIFHEGIDLPYFAAFPLLDSEEGKAALARYFRSYLDIARQHGAGFVLETPTWRASTDWGALLGYDAEALDRINRKAVAFVRNLTADPAYAKVPVVLSGCVGPRGDGYVVGTEMTIEEATAYHAPQIRALAEAGVRLVTGLTMTYPEEAAGIALAARDAGIRAVLSFTVETDGRLPNGQSLAEAIRMVDSVTDRAPAYYMVNCAHPDHFDHVLESDADWTARIHGLRANASRMSHAELDEAEELDAGDPAELGGQYADLRKVLPNLNVMGGCCGTDHRHVGQIALHTCG
ncbi:homocysteine S-methyltransferase family protein [Roseibium sp.]|uniref:homocysteine S-methyltransferase family protein n=1 Tax=Roseibium sp. TaxID=1936156 RepID=UPI003D0F6893